MLTMIVVGMPTQEEELGGIMLVDDHNEFNEMIHLMMLWTVNHRWGAGAQLMFNLYKNWVEPPLCQPRKALVILLRQGGVNGSDPLSMFLYRIPPNPLT